MHAGKNTRMRQAGLRAAYAMTCSLLAACGTAVPATHHYRVVVEAATQLAPEDGPRLVLEDFETDPAYEDERMVYRESAFRLDYDAYNRWDVAPRLLVTTFLRNAYVTQGSFSWVGDYSPAGALPVLSGRVIALEEVALSKSKSVAHLELALWLRSADGHRTLWSERFQHDEPMRERGPDALAEAMSHALNLVAQKTGPALASIVKAETEDGR